MWLLRQEDTLEKAKEKINYARDLKFGETIKCLEQFIELLVSVSV